MLDPKLEALRAVLKADPDNVHILESLRFRNEVAISKAGFLVAYGGIMANLTYLMYSSFSEHSSSFSSMHRVLESLALLMVFILLLVSLIVPLVTIFTKLTYPPDRTVEDHIAHFSRRDMERERAVIFSARTLLIATCLTASLGLLDVFAS